MRRTMIGVVALGIALAAVGTTAPPAGAQLAPRDQASPALAPLGDDTLLVWTEDRGAGSRVYAKRVFANGLPVGGANRGEWELTGVVDPAGMKGDQRWPATDGELLVWSEKLPGGTDYDLYAQRLFANGRAYGQPRLIAGGAGDQVHPDIATAGRGGWLVVWSENTRDAGDVMGMRLSLALTTLGTAFPVAQGPGTAEDPVITSDPSDSDALLVLFTDDRAGNKDIWGTRVTESGIPRAGPLGGQFPVVDGPEDEYAPDAALESRGHTDALRRGPGSTFSGVLLWTRDDVTDGPEVMAVPLLSNGLIRSTPFLLAGGPGAQAWPAVGAPSGLVAWVDDAAGTGDIYGTEVGLNGINRRPPWPLVGD
jgi:hypothetical protein